MEEKIEDKVAEEKKEELTKEQYDSIRRGKRPDGMDFDQYKLLLNAMNKLNKRMLKGEYIHVSKIGDNKGITYKKEKEK